MKELDKLLKFDTSDVEPMFRVFENGTHFREDEVDAYSDCDAVTLINAPKCKDGMIEVPKTV